MSTRAPLAGYENANETRTDHLRLVLQYAE